MLYITEMECRLATEIRIHKRHTHLPPDDDGGRRQHSNQLERMAERLGCAIRLLTLLVRTLAQPEVMLGLARIISLLEMSKIFWEDDTCASGDDLAEDGADLAAGGGSGADFALDPCVEMSSPEEEADSMQDTEKKNMHGDIFNGSESLRISVLNDNKSCRENKNGSFSEIVNTTENSLQGIRSNKSRNIFDSLDILTSSRTVSSELKKRQKKELKRERYLEHKRTLFAFDRKRTRRRSSLLENGCNDVTEVRDGQEIICLAPSAVNELRDLHRCLQVYFAEILQYWFTFGDLRDDESPLCRILVVLEQCHVHEVLPVLDSVKKCNPALIPKMQEELLDQRTLPRIVALLANMYE